MAKNIIESVDTKNVGFGPILRFYFEKCNIAQIIDENVPLDPRRKVLTHGEAGIAMITGILFQALQLYRLCKFAGDKTVLGVILPSIAPEEYFDDRLAQHIELLEVIKSIPCMVMISGYESQLYRDSLNNWHTYYFQAATHHGMATEWIWMNYPPPVQLHDYRYLGNNFREREKIKIKSKRWATRYKSMPVLERQALLSALQSVNDEKY
jgi:hypothetical protein